MNDEFISHSELKSLIELADDPDQGIFEQIKERLISIGNVALPELENAWESTGDEFLQSRLKEVIHDINFSSVKHRLSAWMKNDKDLLEGFFAIGSYQYPTIDTLELTKKIGQITQDIWLELNDNLTALEKVKVINHVFYELHKFRGNTKDFFNPENFYINSIIENRLGSPIGLAILYSAIAQSLKIPIFGINLPEHFVLAYMQRPYTPKIRYTSDDVLFYINPFNMGTMFSRIELEAFLNQMKVKPQKNYFLPCKNTEIIKRVIFNLVAAYTKSGETQRVEELKVLLELFDESA